MTAVFLVVAMYLLPLLACLGVEPMAGDVWRLGYFATVADQVRTDLAALQATV
jgi:hypothetical protein